MDDSSPPRLTRAGRVWVDAALGPCAGSVHLFSAAPLTVSLRLCIALILFHSIAPMYPLHHRTAPLNRTPALLCRTTSLHRSTTALHQWTTALLNRTPSLYCTALHCTCTELHCTTALHHCSAMHCTTALLHCTTALQYEVASCSLSSRQHHDHSYATVPL